MGQEPKNKKNKKKGCNLSPPEGLGASFSFFFNFYVLFFMWGMITGNDSLTSHSQGA
jgi:hypothetical protein